MANCKQPLGDAYRGSLKTPSSKKGRTMNKLWKITKWLLGTLILFGGVMLSYVLRGDPITPRSYVAAALMAGFFAINSLPPKWTVQQRFAFNFCYLFFSMPAVSFYFGDPFTWIHYIFVPLGLALSMAVIFLIWGEQAKP